MAWKPIPIIRVKLEDLSDVPISGMRAGDRVWIEVVACGQVVGIVEAVTTYDEELRTSELAMLTRELSKVVIEPPVPIPTESLPLATVVVPTICQDPPGLVRTVESLLALDYPNFEIVVVDNRRKNSHAPLPQFPGGSQVRTVIEPRPGVSFARNCGIANATGEFVAFTDDDDEVDRNWLREMGSRFVANPEVDGIGGLVLPAELNTQPQLWFEEFFGGFNHHFTAELLSMKRLANTDELFPYAPGRFGAGCNMAFRRSALEREGFNVSLGTGTLARGGEDLARFMNQVLDGGTLAFEPRAVVRHRHRASEPTFFAQVFSYGVGLTAMYTALVLRDPRHAVRMFRRLPAGFRLLSKPRSERSPSTRSSYPTSTYVRHLLGMAYGPVAYLRSALRTRVSN